MKKFLLFLLSILLVLVPARKICSQVISRSDHSQLALWRSLTNWNGHLSAGEINLGVSAVRFILSNGDIFWVPTGTGDWNDPANWSSGSVPGPSDRAFIANGGTAVVLTPPPASVDTLIIGSAGQGAGNLIIRNDAVLITSTAVVDTSLDCSVAVESGSLQVNGVLSFVDPGASANTEIIINSAVTTTGGLNLAQGSIGMLNAGVLETPGVAGSSTNGGIFIFNGGTLRSSGNGTRLLDRFSTGNLILQQTAVIDTNGNDNGIYSTMTGAGGVVITGGGVLTYVENQAYTGDTHIQSGTLIIAGTTPNPQVITNIINNDALIFDRTDLLSVLGLISGAGSVTQAGSGMTVLQANNTYSGLTNITNGTLSQGIANAFSPNSDVTIAAGGTLDAGGVNGTIGALNGVAGSTVTNNGFSSAILSIGATNNNGIFAGSITDGSAGSSLGITKVGIGKETLTGVNPYTGPTIVQSGELTVNGQVTNSNALVNAGGILSGYGRVGGNVVNSGIVSPGDNGVGVLTVGNNYTQNKAGTLLIEINSPASYDRLVVEGTAQLDGLLQVIGPVEGCIAGTTTEYTILTATNGVAGTFSGVTGISNYQLVYNPNDVRLILTCPGTNPENPGMVNIPIEKLIPYIVIDIKDIIFNATNTQYGQITNRLAATRAGSSQFSFQGLSKEPMAEQLSKREEVIAEAREASSWDIFASASGIFSTISNINDLPKVHAMTGYFFVGADSRLNEYINIGIYTGYQAGKAWFSNGSWLRNNGVKFGAYGTAQWAGLSEWKIFNLPEWTFEWKDNFYVNAILGGGTNFFNFNRPIDLGRHYWTARGNPFVGELDSLFGGGYEFNVGAWRFGANTSMQYTYLGISSFSESGARSLNARVGGQNPSSLVYTLGGSISYLWEMAPNYQILPTVGLSWQHEFLNYGQRIGGSFASGVPFNFNTRTGARNNAFGVAGITAQLGPRFGVYAYYNPQFGGGQIVSHGGILGLSYYF